MRDEAKKSEFLCELLQLASHIFWLLIVIGI